MIELDAFQRGFVFWEAPTAEHGPPAPNDTEGLREWLEGFCQAHADYPNTLDLEAGESLAEALDRLLARHSTLPTLKMMLRPM